MDTAYSTQQNAPQSSRSESSPTAMSLTAWGITDTGRQREGNEDAIFPHSGVDTFSFTPGPQQQAQKGQLLVVADGIGGAQAGQEASHWAIRVAVERYYDTTGPDLGTNLRKTVEMANASLHQYLQSIGIRDAGCTMAAAVVHGDTLHVANVGDSRVYLLRNGQITQLTRDHTLTQQKIDQGLIEPEQAKDDPGNHVLTRSMGGRPTVMVDLFPPFQLYPGDAVLLCSDGLTDMLEDKEIARLASNHPPKRAAQKLVAAANRSGGVDNISVVIAQVDTVESSEGQPLATARRRATRKRVILAAGGGLLATLLCAGAAFGWWTYDRRQATPTPGATIPTQAPTATATTALAVETPLPTVTLANNATSTPAPTSTPTQTPVPDADQDGIPDQDDQCPFEAGLSAFDGCPDRDGDGVIDGQDDCPDAPGLTEFRGCPDRDGDGVPDPQDTCPDTSGPVDNGGCPVSSGDNGGGGGSGDDDDGGGGGDGKSNPTPKPKPEPTKPPPPPPGD